MGWGRNRGEVRESLGGRIALMAMPEPCPISPGSCHSWGSWGRGWGKCSDGQNRVPPLTWFLLPAAPGPLPSLPSLPSPSPLPFRVQQALGCPCRSCNSLVEVRATESDLSRTIKAEIGCVALVRVVQAGKPSSVEMLKLLHEHGAPLNGQVRGGGRAGRGARS